MIAFFYLVLGRQMKAVTFSPNWLLEICLNLIRLHYFVAQFFFLANVCQWKVKHYNQKTSSITLKLTEMSQDSVS